jgi:hypothetical protein
LFKVKMGPKNLPPAKVCGGAQCFLEERTPDT